MCECDVFDSWQMAFSFVVYPSLILAYMGQAAYLSKHHILESDYHIGFYVSVPGMPRLLIIILILIMSIVN